MTNKTLKLIRSCFVSRIFPYSSSSEFEIRIRVYNYIINETSPNSHCPVGFLCRMREQQAELRVGPEYLVFLAE